MHKQLVPLSHRKAKISIYINNVIINYNSDVKTMKKRRKKERYL